MKHWIIEVGIALLGTWAMWKSLPREPQLDWRAFQEDLWGVWKNTGSKEQNWITPKVLTLLDWKEFAGDFAKVQQIVARKLQEWIVISTPNGLQMGELLELNSKVVSFASLDASLDEDLNKSSETVVENPSLIDTLERALEKRSQRFLFVAHGEEVQALLEFLHAHPAVRDYTGAVVCIEPEVRSEWMEKHFTHAEMDVEANISIPYLVLSENGASFMQTSADEKGWKAIDVIECKKELVAWSKDNPKDCAYFLAVILCKRMELG